MHPQYQKALRLRLMGKSYNEIARTLSVSKGSLSVWFRDLKLTKSAKKLLEKKTRIAREHGLFENNRQRTRAIWIENQRIKKETFNEIHSLSKYELLLVANALYWAEGYKIEAQKNKGYVVDFVNADPYMIALFLRFLREIIKVPEEKLKVCVRIHANISEQSAINFWARVTNIPKSRFRIFKQISKASNRKRPINSLPYGTLDLRVHGRKIAFRIKGWIDALKLQSGLK